MKMLRTVLLASSALVLSVQLLSAQAGQVTCKDGSKSKGGRGACSSHGGILKAETKMAAKADTKAVKADVKADAKIAKTEKAEKKAPTRKAKTKA